MSGTIETTNNNIILKINAIIKISDALREEKIHAKILNKISQIKEDYEMGSINILSGYFHISNIYSETSDLNRKKELMKEKDEFFSKYHSFIRKDNFVSKLDRIINTVKKYILDKNTTLKLDDSYLQNIYHIIKLYQNSTINKTVKETVYELCTCGSKMEIDSESSSLICKKCGIMKQMYGVVFDDDQFYYQEGQRTKHGTYDPSKHCRFWVERIQARETTEIPEKVVSAIKECIREDKIKNKKQITCNQIRKYLRKTNYSKYNEHVPLVRKLITGITPPQLTDYEMQLIHIYFDKVIHIFEEIKPAGKTNCPYHPYFIYKIIEQILTEKSDRIRKLKILSCIHLQSRETLISNDSVWLLVCNKISNFKYIPTDRNNQYNEF